MRRPGKFREKTKIVNEGIKGDQTEAEELEKETEEMETDRQKFTNGQTRSRI